MVTNASLLICVCACVGAPCALPMSERYLLQSADKSHNSHSMCPPHVLCAPVDLWRGLQVTLLGSDFNTLLAVYTGSAVDALTLVASNDDCNNNDTASCVTFPVSAGTTFSAQVDGFGGMTGAVSINVILICSLEVCKDPSVPPNDAFSAAWTISGISTTQGFSAATAMLSQATPSTVGATLEPGEPLVGAGVSGSVWFRFTAPVASTSATVRRDDMALSPSLLQALR